MRDTPIVPPSPAERAALDDLIAHTKIGKECHAMTCYGCRKVIQVTRAGVDWSVECPHCGWSACGRN